MKLYDAIQLVLELARQTTPIDPDEAVQQATAIEIVELFSQGYFPGTRQKEAKA